MPGCSGEHLFLLVRVKIGVRLSVSYLVCINLEARQNVIISCGISTNLSERSEPLQLLRKARKVL